MKIGPPHTLEVRMLLACAMEEMETVPGLNELQVAKITRNRTQIVLYFKLSPPHMPSNLFPYLVLLSPMARNTCI